MSRQSELTYTFPSFHPEQRLRELILYIAQRCQTDSKFARTKLVKILYFSDFWSYREYREPVTGARYIKQQAGPMPDGFLGLLKAMEQEGDILLPPPMSYFNHEQKRVVPLREPDLTMFNGRDIAMVERVIDELRGRSAKEVSDLSHGPAWRATRMNEAIPYETAIISDEPITDDDIASAEAMLLEYQELGLDV